MINTYYWAFSFSVPQLKFRVLFLARPTGRRRVTLQTPHLYINHIRYEESQWESRIVCISLLIVMCETHTCVKTSYLPVSLHKSVLQHLTAQLFIGLYLEYTSMRELQYSSWLQSEEQPFWSINAPDRSKLKVKVLHCKPALHSWVSSLRHSSLRQYLRLHSRLQTDERLVRKPQKNHTNCRWKTGN